MTGVIKSLWASVQGDPRFMRSVNGWLTIFWIAMIPVSIVTHWMTSVTYVAALSLWALVSGHWAAWQAARVEVKQEEEGTGRSQRPLLAQATTSESSRQRGEQGEEDATCHPPGSSSTSSAGH
jgi:hypothetical protein